MHFHTLYALVPILCIASLLGRLHPAPPQQASIDGVSLGMSRQEVRQLLGNDAILETHGVILTHQAQQQHIRVKFGADERAVSVVGMGRGALSLENLAPLEFGSDAQPFLNQLDAYAAAGSLDHYFKVYDLADDVRLQVCLGNQGEPLMVTLEKKTQ